jgi:hypothetical protein
VSRPATVHSQKDAGLPGRLRPGSRSLTAERYPKKLSVSRSRRSTTSPKGEVQVPGRPPEIVAGQARPPQWSDPWMDAVDMRTDCGPAHESSLGHIRGTRERENEADEGTRTLDLLHGKQTL